MYSLFNPNQMAVTPFLFFTGKGGVGKTSTACATAVTLADQGKKVLLVSTDPASNLQDVLEVELTNTPKSIPSVANLSACNIDPEQAARAYKESVVGPYRGKLPDAVLATMEEQLSGACTVEIAAFDEFSHLLADDEILTQYDHVLFDTAPTGHTLRLLQLPTAWSGFLEDSTHGASCLGPLAGLEGKKALYKKAVDSLSDGHKTTLILVARPDNSSLLEADRASFELKEIGIKNQLLIVNGLLQAHQPEDAVSTAFYKRQREAIEQTPEALKQVMAYSLPYVSYSLTGVANLRHLFSSYAITSFETEEAGEPLDLPGLNSVIDDFSKHNTRVIFTMGKGGVGKTSIASAIAVGLSEKGHNVHLTTTDPAAHLAYTFEGSGTRDNLSISSINPDIEVARYKETVIEQAGGGMTEEELAYLKEDLESPCTEEIALFQAFAKVVEKSEEEIVVIDTAPTGHTLLLLDSTEAYHKEMSRSTGDVPDSVKKLLPRLRNPKETGVVIVTLAEATPVLEAARLEEDLKRAGIEPKWWVINQSLYVTDTADAVLKGRAISEKKWIRKVDAELAEKCAIIPWLEEEKIGYEQLKEFIL
ncbi:arsenical pump-driving ATPase [Planococcus sp. CP5-4]|uniref:arsenical pump-driving ATPase n=1 Tax=unclassified Planococcus (in: firmicutes) TaxID=2662419 RepID=UPI001C246A2D|nr:MULTISPECIES: arsenical pump-driving ATPase [unclassified Planococcus (in: firmicutes)]MBU9673656.1 arsenical pump-driving ATPase [Planococcus sp. CP5-4_YE]MBV0907946.1 arsenical pump-driving ATPase [Planococcus sp. CP5-4_UN]MBW6063113.1 arsenical pump-driving ATPase [Planococcus sp. CP5-4]